MYPHINFASFSFAFPFEFVSNNQSWVTAVLMHCLIYCYTPKGWNRLEWNQKIDWIKDLDCITYFLIVKTQKLVHVAKKLKLLHHSQTHISPSHKHKSLLSTCQYSKKNSIKPYIKVAQEIIHCTTYLFRKCMLSVFNSSHQNLNSKTTSFSRSNNKAQNC